MKSKKKKKKEKSNPPLKQRDGEPSHVPSCFFFLNFQCIEFDEVMRQQGDSQKRFREILNAVATGTFKQSHWKDLEKRYIPSSLFFPVKGAMET